MILDHHKTAAEHLGVAPPAPQEQQQQQQQQGEGGAEQPSATQPQPPEPLPPNMRALLDMGRSGAGLALDFFGREGLPGGLVTAFEFVQDADLWAWRLGGSRAFHAGLAAEGLEYDAASNPGIFERLLALDVGAVVAKGEAILEEQERAIAAAVAAAKPVTLGGTKAAGRGWGQALAVAAAGDLVKWRSALGNALARRGAELGLAPVGVVAYVEPGMARGKVKVSLRAVDGWATTAVTEAHGGGGHLLASACVVDDAEWAAWDAAGALHVERPSSPMHGSP